MNNTPQVTMNTPSTSHNGNNQFYPTGSVEDNSKKKDPVLPNFDVVLTKYDLEPPKIKSKDICAKHSQYEGLFRAMNCHPVSTQLVDEEENRKSIFEECHLRQKLNDKKKNEPVSVKGNKQTKPYYSDNYYSTFKRTQITSSVVVEVDEIEENRESIFEELELPQQSVATKKEESTSAEEIKPTQLFCNDIYLGTFQLTNAQRASRLIRPTLTPINSISLSQTDTDPLTVEYRSTSTCKNSKIHCDQSCSQSGSSEKCSVDELRSFSEISSSPEHENFSSYQLIFPPLRRSISEVYLLNPQNRRIRFCSYLQRARQFLRYNLGFRK
ncbi:hypothetical protein TNCV_28841 [Trichonephila clavipes]|nr:hypothetical protein TNCV_28841 [Trichonephila clavipes]